VRGAAFTETAEVLFITIAPPLESAASTSPSGSRPGSDLTGAAAPPPGTGRSDKTGAEPLPSEPVTHVTLSGPSTALRDQVHVLAGGGGV
jgi:hypothetical protein